jgi:hypothetical protein
MHYTVLQYVVKRDFVNPCSGAFHMVWLIFSLVSMARTKPKRWLGISWICTHVLPEGQVSLIGHLLWYASHFRLTIFSFAAFLGKVLKQEQRSKSMRKLARRKLQHQLRFVQCIFSWNWNFSLGNVLMLSIYFRLYAVGILLSLHHISIIAVHCDLMTSLTIPISSDYSVTFLSAKVSSFACFHF